MNITISIYKEEDVLGGQSVKYSDPFDIVNDVHHVLSDMRAKKWTNMTRQQKASEFCDSLARLWKIVYDALKELVPPRV